MTNAASTTPTPLLTYRGPREILLQTPVDLLGDYLPAQVATVTLMAEDKFPLTVQLSPLQGLWRVQLKEGFYNVGVRWLRLRGLDTAGKVVAEQIINLTVTDDSNTVGQPLVLRVLQDTWFKQSATDSAKLGNAQKVPIRTGQSFLVKRYSFVDGHLQVDLQSPLAPVGSNGCFFEPHVELKKADQILRFDIDDVPVTIPGTAQVLVLQDTLLKASPNDSSTLPANQKLELLAGHNFEITGYACMQGHFRVTLTKPIPNFGTTGGTTGFIYWQHIQIQKNGQAVIFDPDALTLTVLENTVFKKRPVDSSNLRPEERFAVQKGQTFGVASYAMADGHVRVALTENLPNFGNTGCFFPKFVQLRSGGKLVDVNPAKLELNVPYLCQRDNAFRPMATCNVTSMAMVLAYYGIRAKNPRQQLEDEFYEWCIARYGQGSQTDNTVLVKLANAYGFKDNFSTNHNWTTIRNELNNRRPVIVGGLFTHSGHIVVIIGYTPQGYIVNDPFGNALTGYRDSNGRRLVYPSDYMEKMCSPEPGSGNIFAHLISR